ncbi:hypothetical protein KIS1582_0199 [Cytobacillus firmus]|uniref:Uncharacterized protein n=1 Tax=Cytobacillus firmus TaxID=1399 RepID=A0A800NGK5_CYTFI|nr:hypothetical protein KIS1582_0199 [Cytobacillus firmus]
MNNMMPGGISGLFFIVKTAKMPRNSPYVKIKSVTSVNI